MISKYKVLRCPCGCDLPADSMIEVLYARMRKHFGHNLKVLKAIDCSDVVYTNGLVMNVTLRSVHNDRSQKILKSYCDMYAGAIVTIPVKHGIVVSYRPQDSEVTAIEHFCAWRIQGTLEKDTDV